MNASMTSLAPSARLITGFALGLLVPLSASWAQAPQVGPNVNMVSGTRFPEGDWNLTKQNEVSLAVSSRNPRHLMAGSNDYRLVLPDTAEGLRGAKAWVSLYKSVDGGTTWFTTIPGGCPLNIPQCNDATGLTAPLKALAPDFSADPTVRAGPYGTFFYSFIAGTRATSTNGVVAIQRFVDKNDDIQRAFDVRTVLGNDVMKPPEDPIVPDAFAIIDQGVQGQFVDKPWNIADVPGRSWNVGKPKCDLLSWTRTAGAAVRNVAELVDPFNVYVSFANFAGQGANQHPNVFVAASNNCGTTFGKPVKVSNSLQASQGTQLAVDPLSGAVYVVWRVFADSSGPDAIYISKSTDGGNTWLNQPKLIATIKPYDQDASGGAFRTLGFPTIAVSVQNGVSRVHVAWTQRKAMPNSVAPFACPAANPADCDARIVMSTSIDGGLTWPAAAAVDSAFKDPLDATKPGRGHQLQPALAFTGGKLMLTWLDQRFDHTEEVLTCPTGALACTSRREAKGNLVPSCSVDVSGSAFAALPQAYRDALAQCRAPYMTKASDAVWTTYLTDGTPGLVRRHTIDVFGAMADAGATPTFTSNPVSRYVFGTTAADVKGVREIRQKEFNAPNLPMFVNGTAAFIGDYIDVAGAAIVAAGGSTTNPSYKFDVGCAGAACGPFTTGGKSPVFHVGFTDNRSVIPPGDGDWTRKTCLTTEFTTDTTGAANGITNFGVACNFAGAAGNRNQNVFSAVVAESSVAFANANSKRIGTVDPRGFVVTVENLTDTDKTYQLTVNPQSGLALGFDKDVLAANGTAPPPLTITVQPRSSSTRSIWVKSTTDDDRRPVAVSITGVGNPFQSQVLLNPDPAARHVGNGDGNGQDLANNDLGSVVLSNAVLSNNVLTNAVLDDPTLGANVLSNVALTNAALSNVVLSNAVLSNLQVENLTPTSAVLSNNAVTNAVLSNVVLSNAVLTNDALINAALSNAVLSNAVLSNVVLSNQALAEITTAVLSNNALSNLALSNIDPANVALSNAVLSNNALSNAVLSNNALSNAVLSNDALTNAALSNVALSNAALSNAVLSNAVLSNNVLSNAVLSNAALTDDPETLKAVEQANFDLSRNSFVAGDLQASNFNFADASFTVRNRGNTDTTLAVKLLLRDSTNCDPVTHVCTLPDGVKLQLVLRKIALTPTAIPPTERAVNVPYDPISGAGRALRIGLTQRNALVSNVGTPVIVDPADPNLGRFLPDAPDAATLPLSPGERAYVTLRALGTPGSTTNPFEFLRWGSKFVVVDASSNTNTRIPLVIKTLALPAVTAAQPASLTVATFGGLKTLAGQTTVAVPLDAPPFCADSLGNPATGGACPASFSVGPFADDGTGTQTSVAQLSFTAPRAGTFYVLLSVKDTSVPEQFDRQLLKVVVNPVLTQVTFNTSNFPAIAFGQQPPFDLRTLVTGGAIVTNSPAPITFSAGPPEVCRVGTDGFTLVTLKASPLPCVVVVRQAGTEVYTPIEINSPPININKGTQTITAVAPTVPITYSPSPNTTVTLQASTTSALQVSFTPTTPAVCTVIGNVATIVGAGTCSITVSQAGDSNYLAAPPATIIFTVGKASQTISFAPPPNVNFGITATVPLVATASSALAVSFTTSSAATVCTVSGSTATIAGPGTCTITASQPGDANFSAAPPVTLSFTIQSSVFTATGAMIQPRTNHTATLLFDGRVLVAGGFNSAGASTDTSEFYCPAASTVCSVAAVGKFTNAGTLPSKSAGHTATRLSDGRVLVAGGGNSSTEIFNPATNTWSASGGMGSTRSFHTATLLGSGTNVKVLLAGGADNAGKSIQSTLIYDPATGSFSNGPLMSTARERHSAIFFNGKVLIAGGRQKAGSGYTVLQTAELCDTATCTTVSPMALARYGHSVAFTSTAGQVIVVGGSDASPLSAELFNGSGWTTVSMNSTTRRDLALTQLFDGRLLVAGGVAGTARLNTSSLYGSGFVAGPNMVSARSSHRSTRLQDGRVLVTGGVGTGNVAIGAAELYSGVPYSGPVPPGPPFEQP